MGILRTTEFLSNSTLETTRDKIVESMKELEMEVEVKSPTSVKGNASRSLMKNRWAAEVNVELIDQRNKTKIIFEIDMLGTKHFGLLMEITNGISKLLDDRNIEAVAEKLGKAGKFFGGQELRILPTLLYGDEKVVALGSGQYEKNLCILCLTNERILFVDKGLFASNLKVTDIPIKTVTAVSTKRSITGEKIEIVTSGAKIEIDSVMHGQAENLSRQIREVQNGLNSSITEHNIKDFSPLDEIKKLAELYASGILSDEEFALKKSQLLDRI